MCTMMLNDELNGVELYFKSKPLQNIIDSLKEFKFKRNRSKACWYAKQNDTTLKLAQELATGETDTTNKVEIASTTTKTNKTELASLWERIQFTPGVVTKDDYDYKYVGSNYTPGLAIKEIAAEARKHLKNRFPEVKFSITCKDYNSIRCKIVSSPYNNKSLEYSPKLEPRHYREYEAEHNKELFAIREYATKLLQSYNYDDSDSMTDYFSTNFYGDDCQIDYNYTQIEQTETIKTEIDNFRLQLIEAEKQAKIQKEIEFQKYLKQSELNRISNEEYGKQQKINTEIVNNDVTYTDLAEQDQYMINNIKIAHLNKNNTYAEYQKEIAKGEDAYTFNDMKITREIHFQTSKAMDLFKNMFLHDFKFISDTGGTYTNNNTFTSMTDYRYMTSTERKNINWNLCGIAVYYNSELQFVIDAQGHNYARYVGITDNAKIEPVPAAEPITDETQNYKTVAQAIEDISKEIICNNQIADFKTSQEYKTLLLNSLKMFDIMLSMPIIRLIEVEELKVYLYSLLAHINSVQEQFRASDIRQGDKITIISIDDMMGMTHTSRVTFDRYENAKYAQYDDAVKITFTPEKKRKLYYTYYHSNRNFLIVADWVTIPENILWEEFESETGLSCRRTKYLSCDIQQLIDIKDYLIENEYNILIDRIQER